MTCTESACIKFGCTILMLVGKKKMDSDIDLLIVLQDESVKTGREIDQLNDQLFDLILTFGKDISYLPMSKNRFETAQEPLPK